MNTKQAKSVRRQIRKMEDKIIISAMKQMLNLPFRDRLGFAWEIVKGKKPPR